MLFRQDNCRELVYFKEWKTKEWVLAVYTTILVWLELQPNTRGLHPLFTNKH